MAEEPDDVGCAPIDREALGAAALVWLKARAHLDAAQDAVEAAKARVAEARGTLRDADRALLAEAALSTNQHSVRRVVVPSVAPDTCVVVNHDGAHALTVLLCPGDGGAA